MRYVNNIFKFSGGIGITLKENLIRLTAIQMSLVNFSLNERYFDSKVILLVSETKWLLAVGSLISSSSAITLHLFCTSLMYLIDVSLVAVHFRFFIV